MIFFKYISTYFFYTGKMGIICDPMRLVKHSLIFLAGHSCLVLYHSHYYSISRNLAE